MGFTRGILFVHLYTQRLYRDYTIAGVNRESQKNYQAF